MVKMNMSVISILKLLGLSSSNVKNYSLISKLCIVSNLEDNSCVFLRKLDEISLKLIKSKNNVIVFAEDVLVEYKHAYIVENSRYSMSILLEYIDSKRIGLDNMKNYSYIDKSSVIDESVILGYGVYIGPNCHIDEGTSIGHGCIIVENTRVGKKCVLRENSVIGGQGFGVEKRKDDSNFKIPHLGGVVIGDNVEIGALNTVCSGTIEPTIIQDFVKTDDHIHIAHNCFIGKNSNLTASVVLSGSVILNESVYIGPNSTIRNGVSISKGTMIGISSLVTKSIKIENSTFLGVPATDIESFKRTRNIISKIVNDQVLPNK